MNNKAPNQTKTPNKTLTKFFYKFGGVIFALIAVVFRIVFSNKNKNIKNRK